VQALVTNRRAVTYAEVDAPQGHDASHGSPALPRLARAWFDRIAQELSK
jgi:homoserine O-acetyltransferase (EC 2.3.1.31)